MQSLLGLLEFSPVDLLELLELLSPALSLLLRLLDGLDNLLLEGAPALLGPPLLLRLLDGLDILLLEGAPALLGPPLLLLDALVGLLLEATPASLHLLCELLAPFLQ